MSDPIITVCVQQGSHVYVYGEKRRLLFTLIGQLQGFTSGTVSVKQSNSILVYDARRKHLSTHPI